MYFRPYISNTQLSTSLKILYVKFHIFYESGVSYYHTNLSKEYKVSRRIDDLYGLDKEKRDVFFKVLSKNYQLIEKALVRIPDIKVIRMKNLEADFIPYYLIKNQMVDNGPHISNIVYSNDHDLLQTLEAAPNVFIFQKAGKTKRIVKRGEAVKTYLKCDEDYPDSFLPISMAIMGDPGDDVGGIRGIGKKRVVPILYDFVGNVGGVEKLYDNVYAGRPIFHTDGSEIKNKIMRMVFDAEQQSGLISRNLKLVSFELLRRFVDHPVKTEMAEKRDRIQKLMNEIPSTVPIESMYDALGLNRVFIQEDDLETLYFKKEKRSELGM